MIGLGAFSRCRNGRGLHESPGFHWLGGGAGTFVNTARKGVVELISGCGAPHEGPVSWVVDGAMTWLLLFWFECVIRDARRGVKEVLVGSGGGRHVEAIDQAPPLPGVASFE